jgi:NADPH-dependent 2,4-dienoyl-CoA reductase/sulfur reductase-like enzyme
MARELNRVVVVGASLAGLRACESLRTEGFDGAITLIGAEHHLPYDRPPLSKKVLAGEWEPDRITLRKPEAFDELGLDARYGTTATGLDVGAQRVGLSDGTNISYDGLVIATGTTCRRLPNQPDWVHEVRTLDDSLRLRAELTAGRRLVVVGAGFIGLEVAATARQRGLEVTVLEGAPAPLIRGLGAEMGTAVAAIHADHGVELRCGVQVESLGRDGVRLAGGELVPADLIVVGIGVVPATDWLAGSGLEIRDGIVCDATMSAGVDGVYAAGDCARWVNPLFDEEMRVEHWTNAAEQGAIAAKNLLAVARGDEPQPYRAIPFFWSDQYDARIQFLGRASGDDEVRVVAGSVAEQKFVALYGRNGRLRGALGLSMPRVVMPYRKLLDAEATWDQALAHAASVAAS